MSFASADPPHARQGSHPDDRQPVILLGRRTAFARRNGALRGLTAADLLAPVLAAVLADSGLPADRKSVV